MSVRWPERVEREPGGWPGFLALLFAAWVVVILIGPWGGWSGWTAKALGAVAAAVLAVRAARCAVVFGQRELVVRNLLRTRRVPYSSAGRFELKAVPYVLARVVLHLEGGRRIGVYALGPRGVPSPAMLGQARRRLELLEGELAGRRAEAAP
jgi:hypothetical protein